MRRVEAREQLMQMIFQMEAQQDFSKEKKTKYLELFVKPSNQNDYINMLYSFISENLKELDKQIEQCSNNWKLNRIAKVDLAVLRLATAEIFYMKDIPIKVSANEAVTLAKKFGGEDSGTFVNGVLGTIVRKLPKEKKED